MTTVQELIDQLLEIKDKSMPIEVSTRDGWQNTYDDIHVDIKELGSGWVSSKGPIVLIN